MSLYQPKPYLVFSTDGAVRRVATHSFGGAAQWYLKRYVGISGPLPEPPLVSRDPIEHWTYHIGAAGFCVVQERSFMDTPLAAFPHGTAWL